MGCSSRRAAWLAPCCNTLGTRYLYTTLVLESLNEAPEARSESIKRAFMLMPWRQEAPVAFERQTYELRTLAGTTALRKYVRDFVEDERVKGAVTRVAESHAIPLPLDRNAANTLFDPVLWYAGLLPEAEDDTETALTKEAIAYLKNHEPFDLSSRTSLLRQSLELQLLTNDVSERRSARKSLMQFFDTHEYKASANSHEYQVASDTIATSWARGCRPYEASLWFQRVLDARRTGLDDNGMPLWHRPPHKLLLYHLFMAYSAEGGSDMDLANRLLNYQDASCDQPYRVAFERDFLAQAADVPFKARAGWLRGTTMAIPLEGFLKDSLQRGWRY